MNRFILSIFFIFYLFIQLPSLETKHKPATIIYLKGSCSSGKSTLIKTIKAFTEDLVVVDEDAYLFTTYPKAIETRFPIEYAMMDRAIENYNIYHSLKTDDRCYKLRATDNECVMAEFAISTIVEELNRAENLAWKKHISQSITDRCLDEIENALQNNKDVLIDAWYIKPDQLQTLYPNNPLIKVMLYCPLEVAYQRLLKRNRQAIFLGNLSEKRLALQLIGSFCSLYEITLQPLQPIEQVELSTFNDTFELIAENLSENVSPRETFSFKEMSKSELQVIQSKFLHTFKKCGFKPCYINTKEPYDLIIDNKNLKSEEAVEIFKEILFTNNFLMNNSFLVMIK